MLKSQLNLCPLNYNDVLNILKFGALTESICEFDLTTLVKWDTSELPVNANYFFDLFILDKNGNLIDVPVLIQNFRDSQGSNPNSDTADFSNSWRFVRRFFIYDTISGIDQVGGYLNNSVPSVVRFASSIKFKIALDPNNPESIYNPYVEIVYREKITN